jgi:hypothetical protein
MNIIAYICAHCARLKYTYIHKLLHATCAYFYVFCPTVLALQRLQWRQVQVYEFLFDKSQIWANSSSLNIHGNSSSLNAHGMKIKKHSCGPSKKET